MRTDGDPDPDELLDPRPDRRPVSRWWWALALPAVAAVVVVVVRADGGNEPRPSARTSASVGLSLIPVTPAADPTQTRVPGGCPAGQSCAAVSASRGERTSIAAATTAVFGSADRLVITTSTVSVDGGAAQVLFSRIFTASTPAGRVWVLVSRSSDDANVRWPDSGTAGALSTAHGVLQGFYVRAYLDRPATPAVTARLGRLAHDPRIVTEAP